MNLLNRAKQFLQAGAPALPLKSQNYYVACPEGHRLSGVRTEGYQALRCPTCGEGIFILPRSPLPQPPAPPQTQRAPKGVAGVEVLPSLDDPISLSDPSPLLATGEAAEPEIEWVDEDDAPEAPAPPQVDPYEAAFEEEERRKQQAPTQAQAAPVKRPTQTRAPRPAEPEEGERPAAPRPKARPRPVAQPVPERPVILVPAPPPFDLRAWIQRNRNVLIFSGVGLLVVCTVAYRVWLSGREDLPEVVKIGRTQGLKALDEGRFDTAHQLLARAKRAVESLHDQVEGAADVRQGAAEAEILTSLSSDSLEAILGDAATRDPDEWASRFKTFYLGRSVIVDAHVERIPGQGDSNRYELDYAIVPDGTAVGAKPPSVGRVDVNGLKLFERLQPRVGDKVRFGAKLASFRFDPDAEVWRVGFEPDSGVQMKHERALTALEWPADEAQTEEEERQ